MGFWFLDDKTQLALLLAGLVGAGGAAGCDDGRPVELDAGPDARIDVMISDMVPPDARPDVMISDMVPPDAAPDVPVADPLPSDASAASPTPWPGPEPFKLPQQAQAPQAPGLRDRLPLNRSLRTTIVARPRSDGPGLVLTARSSAPPTAKLSYGWRVSGGELERSDDPAVVYWSPPVGRGRHMAQVTVRDQDRTIFVAVHLHTVE